MRQLVLWIAAAAIVALTGTNGYTQSTDYKSTDYTWGTPGLWGDWGSREQKSKQIWKWNDDCGQESFRKFPDYTTEGALKRDVYMRECLRSHHAPPRAELAQPVQPKQ
jgi:hypothetical protein